MAINVRSTDLNSDEVWIDVSLPYLFRNPSVATSSASSGYNYISTSTPHYFKTGDYVGVDILDDRFDANEASNPIEKVNDYTIRYPNNIPTTNVNTFLPLVGTTINSSVTAKRRYNNFLNLKLSSTHRYQTNDYVLVSQLGTGFADNDYFYVVNAAPGGFTNRIRFNQVGPDWPEAETINARLIKNVVTIETSSRGHNFNVGDSVVISGPISIYNGTYTITSVTSTRFTYSRTSDTDRDWEEFAGSATLNTADADGFFADNGQITFNYAGSVTQKSMSNNIANLTISNNRFINNDVVNITIGDSWFDYQNKVVSSSGSIISYDASIPNSVAYGTIKGWTKPRYIDLFTNDISNIVYPDLPLIYSVIVSPTTQLSVGTTLTATISFNNTYRYQIDSIAYQWLRSDVETTSGVEINAANSASYTLTSSDLDKYITFRVTATNVKGTTTAFSTPLFFAGPLPAPTGLTSSSITTTTATLSWNSVAQAGGGYEYAYGIGANTTPTNWSSNGINTNGGVNSVSISGLGSNTIYTFRVRAKRNSTDTNGIISSIVIYTLMSAPTISARVDISTQADFGRAIITNTPIRGGGAITPSSTSPVYIKMQYRTGTEWVDLINSSNSALTQIYTQNFTALEYKIPKSGTGSITLGNDYFFRSAIVDSSGNFLSGYSASTVTAVRPFGPPPAPTSISASSSSDGTAITMTWNNSISSDSPVLGWAVSRRPVSELGAATSWVKYATPTTNSHTFSSLTPNTPYTVSVKALIGTVSTTGIEPDRPIDYATVFSTNYSSQSITTASVPATPSRPTTTTNFTTKITVSWSAPANGGSSITEYHIQRSTDGINWPETYNTWGATTFSFDATGVEGNTNYYYRVRAKNAVGDSAWSPASLAGRRVKLFPALSLGSSLADGFNVNHTNLDTANFTYSATVSNTTNASSAAPNTNPFKVTLSRSVTTSGTGLGISNSPTGNPIPRLATATVGEAGITVGYTNPSSTVTVTATLTSSGIVDGSTTSASGSGSALTVTKSYQWQRSSSSSTGFTAITGANSASYTTTITDRGQWIRCRIIYSATGASSATEFSPSKQCAA